MRERGSGEGGRPSWKVSCTSQKMLDSGKDLAAADTVLGYEDRRGGRESTIEARQPAPLGL